MKINLPKHSIIQRTRSQLQGNSTLSHLGLKEIPLSYINFDNVIKNPRLTVNKDFVGEERRLIRPYDSFSSEDVYLFDSDNNPVKKTMKRIGDTYYYEPSNQTEFTPLNFDVYLQVRRQQQYYNDRIYDIKVSAVDTSGDLYLVKTLMGLFGNSYRNGMCPSNIRFNSGSQNYMTLLEEDYASSDFVFIESADGTHYGSSEKDEDLIYFEDIMDNYTNVWMFCDSYAGRLSTFTSVTSENTLLHMKEHILYDNDIYSVPRNQTQLFDQTIGFLETQGPDIWEYEYLNEAILISHRIGKGYLIISPSWFLDDLSLVSHMMYEAIMKCYLSGYYKSRTLSAWITDLPVDYQCYQKNKFGRHHNKLTISDFLADEQPEDGSYIITDIRVTTPYVKYTGMTLSGELTFQKVGSDPDPQKQTDEVSFYTTKHTVINYKPEDLYMTDTTINFEFATTDNVLYLTVHPYISSKNRICTVSDQTFKIEDLSVDYALFVDTGSTDLHNLFYLLKVTEQVLSSYKKVADITFETEQVPVAYDTRIMGGGLPDDQPDDYDMLDIGHVLGRPYRVGASLVIRLPIRLQNYKDRISTELDKHIAAGDEYVLVFEKQT